MLVHLLSKADPSVQLEKTIRHIRNSDNQIPINISQELTKEALLYLEVRCFSIQLRDSPGLIHQVNCQRCEKLEIAQRRKKEEAQVQHDGRPRFRPGTTAWK